MATWKNCIYIWGYLTFFMTSSSASDNQYEKLDISNEDLEEKVDAFVDVLLRCRKFVGANVAIVHGNDTLLSKGYGRLSLDNNDTITNRSLFGIASLSKAFTATLLGIVLDKSAQGYTWDTKVRDVLGEDFYFYNAELTMEVTLRDLLTHRTGLDSNNNLRHQSGLDRETLAKKIRFIEPSYPIRSTFKYNNILYGLLTHVTEVIGSDTWENLMRRYIFEPLGMTSSDFTHEMDLSQPNLATTYQVDYEGKLRPITAEFHSYWGKIGGSGSIVSNAEDMTKWVKALINRGINQNGDSVIPKHIIEESRTRFMSIATSSSDTPFLQPAVPISYSHFEYGLAWRIGFYRGWRTVLHTGSSFGYLAQLTLIPDLDLGIHSSLTSDDPGHTGRRLLHIYIMDLLLGKTPWLNLTSACDFPQARPYRNENQKDHVRLLKNKQVNDTQLYVGTYGDFAYGNVTVYINETTGSLMLAYGDLAKWTLIAVSQDHDFYGVGNEHRWTWNIKNITFFHSADADKNGPFDKFNIINIRIFTRGLQMDEAPAPPQLECDASCDGNIQTFMITTMIYSFACLSLLH